MKVKIFANNINHLTDARYFAAWGASWMCYNVSSLSLTEIAAIKEWVEGPKHIINIIGIDRSEAMAMMTNEAIDGYLTDNVDEHNAIYNGTQRPIEAFILGHGAIKNATSIHKVEDLESRDILGGICDIQGSPTSIIQYIEKQSPFAILLAGSEEEEVGVKSFEELDEILEHLEEKEL